jgi:choline dehydrogenase
MKIETSKAHGALYEAFLASGQQMGLKHVDDHNAFQQEGVHITQRNIHNGVRCSSYEGYIRSQPRKNNLSVFTNTRVTKIEMSNKRVVRVLCVKDGQNITFEIERETILCGGAINSPQILQLSGIGNADDLRSVGVTVAHHLPGVGYGLKDHVAGPIMYRATKNVSAAKELTALGKAKIGLQWLLFKTGYGATNFFEVGTFMRSRDAESVPNVQFEFVPMLGEVQHGNVAIENGFQYYFSLMRPKSEGRVSISSGDPMAAPRFTFNYLKERSDLEQCVEAVKAVRDTIRQKAWDEIRGAEVSPGPSIKTDDDIRGWLRAAASTNYHPCCSCRMGIDDKSVVDSNGKVHGIDALRIVDASTMPEIVSGNLNAPIIMMAEKIADDVLGRAPLMPDPQPYFQPH